LKKSKTKINTSTSAKKPSLSGTFKVVSIYDLLSDAVFQHRHAKLAKDSYSISRFARASILASALSVECVANCLLDSLKLDGPLHGDLDKLPALSKFATYFQIKTIEGFTRGRIEVQRMAELMAARNTHVHPKVQSIPAELSPVEDANDEWIFPFGFSSAPWPGLKIPKSSMVWSSDSSLSVLTAIAEFFSFIFTSLKLEEEDLKHIFMTRFEFGEVRMGMLFDEIHDELKGIGKEGVDFSCFGIFSDEDNEKTVE
jgi:hypothetical protein